MNGVAVCQPVDNSNFGYGCSSLPHPYTQHKKKQDSADELFTQQQTPVVMDVTLIVQVENIFIVSVLINMDPTICPASDIEAASSYC